MARLPQGVRARAKGGYEKRFTVDGVRYSVYGATPKECMKKETEKRQAIAAGTYTKNNAVTFGEYFAEWCEMKAKQVKGATLLNYTTCYNKHLDNVLGRCKVQKIERRQIVQIQQRVAEMHGVSTGNRAKLVISMVLENAVLDGIITANPADHIPQLKRKGRKITETTHKALSAQEITDFLAGSKESWYYNAFRFMLATGVRCGECGALEPRDIDYKANVIHIRRTVTRDASGKWILGDTPKTAHSCRVIPINAEIRAILNEQMKYNNMMFGIALDKPIFRSERGGLMNTSTANSFIRYKVTQLNKQGKEIHMFSVHALRDTFATMAARKHVPMNVLKELLGHASYQMTADRYAQVYEEEKQEVMKGLSILEA